MPMIATWSIRLFMMFQVIANRRGRRQRQQWTGNEVKEGASRIRRRIEGDVRKWREIARTGSAGEVSRAYGTNALASTRPQD